jgi:hypothetical protein
MPENKYEKRRKQKKVATAVASASTAGLVVLGIVSFLGRDIGSFTVKLENEGVKLALSRKYASDEKTSFLLVNTLPTFEQYTYGDLPSDDVLDNEEYDYVMKGAANYSVDDDTKLLSLNYFKYTFYVSNEGTKAAGYDLNFNIVENNQSTDGTNRSLLDTLHVVVYQNAVTENGAKTHDKVIYAKAPDEPRKDLEGNFVDKEYVSTPVDQVTKLNPFYGFAEPFVTDPLTKEVTGICSYNYYYLDVNKYVRYTLVCWLEGQDPSDKNGIYAPEGASLKLEVKVNGYESKVI